MSQIRPWASGALRWPVQSTYATRQSSPTWGAASPTVRGYAAAVSSRSRARRLTAAPGVPTGAAGSFRRRSG